MHQLFHDIYWTYYNNARAVNLLFLAIVISGMTADIITKRRELPRRMRRLLFWVFLFFANSGYRIATDLSDNIRMNSAIVLNTFILFGMVVSIFWAPEGDDSLPPHDNSIGSRFQIWMNRLVIRIKSRKEHKARRMGQRNQATNQG